MKIKKMPYRKRGECTIKHVRFEKDEIEKIDSLLKSAGEPRGIKAINFNTFLRIAFNEKVDRIKKSLKADSQNKNGGSEQ